MNLQGLLGAAPSAMLASLVPRLRPLTKRTSLQIICARARSCGQLFAQIGLACTPLEFSLSWLPGVAVLKQWRKRQSGKVPLLEGAAGCCMRMQSVCVISHRSDLRSDRWSPGLKPPRLVCARIIAGTYLEILPRGKCQIHMIHSDLHSVHPPLPSSLDPPLTCAHIKKTAVRPLPGSPRYMKVYNVRSTTTLTRMVRTFDCIWRLNKSMSPNTKCL